MAPHHARVRRIRGLPAQDDARDPRGDLRAARARSAASPRGQPRLPAAGERAYLGRHDRADDRPPFEAPRRRVPRAGAGPAGTHRRHDADARPRRGHRTSATTGCATAAPSSPAATPASAARWRSPSPARARTSRSRTCRRRRRMPWTPWRRSTPRAARASPSTGDLRDESFAASIVDDTVTAFGGLDILVLNAAYQKDRDGLEIARHRRARPRLQDEPLRPDLHGARRDPAPAPGLVDHRDLLDPGVQPVAGPHRLRDDEGRSGRVRQGARRGARAEGHPRERRGARARSGRRSSRRPGWDSERLATFGKDTPLGRAGQPAELAGAYVYLASEDASYVSGAVLPVTGGKGL